MLDQLFILNTSEQTVAALSNSLPGACPIIDFRQSQEALEGGGYGDTCALTVPANHPDAAYVIEGNYVLYQDADGYWQEYKLVTPVRTDGSAGSTITATGEHAFYELLGDPISDIRPTDTTASAAVIQALTGTRWTIGQADDLGTNSVRIYYTTVLAGLTAIATQWGGELRFRLDVVGGVIAGRRVDILARRGSITGKRFELKKDLVEVKQTINIQNLCSALIGRGKGVEIDGGTDTTDPAYGRRLDFSDVVWDKYPTVPVTNPVVNGDFSGGTTGWTALNGTNSVTVNTCTNTGNGTSTSSRLVGTSVGSKALGKKLYCRCKARVTNAVSTQIRFDIRQTGEAAALIAATQLNPTQNIWYTLSGVVTVDATYMAAPYTNMLPYILHSYAASATESGKVMEVQEVLAIDLTATFGAGLEPTAAQCDAYFPSWFGGTQNFIAVWATPINPADKPAGQTWIDDAATAAAYGPGGRNIFQFVNFDDCTDAATLLQLTYDELQVRKTAQMTYEMTVIILEAITGYEHEAVRLGDTVNVINTSVIPAITGQARVILLDVSLTNPMDGNVKLGNYLPSIDRRMTSLQTSQQAMQDRQGSWDRAGQAILPADAGSALQTKIDLLTTQLTSTISNFYTDANGNFVFEDPGQTTALKLGAGIIGMANTKSGGEYVWRTFATGAGYTADEMTTGVLNAAIMFAGTLLAASGTITDLIAGNPDAAHMRTGVDTFGDPFMDIYDDDNVMQRSVRKDGDRYSSNIVQQKVTIGNRTGIGTFIT